MEPEPVRPHSPQSALEESHGLIAILDALGAADYTRERVRDYLDAREAVQAETARFAEKQIERIVGQYQARPLQWFVFQDTIILVYQSPNEELTHDEVVWFGHVLRTLQTSALSKNILFRGSFAAGEFYKVSRDTNTVLGPAVRDAARWYDKADWIGVHATPRTSLRIRALLHQNAQDIKFVLVDYPVPLKAQGRLPPTMTLQAVNWPKGLHLRYSDNTSEQNRGVLERCLAHDEIPLGAEQKHVQATEFFAKVVGDQGLAEPWAIRSRDKNAKNPAKRKVARKKRNKTR